MKSTLRLLLTKDCNRSCIGCCNKDWDLDSLPICEDFFGYDEIILTGGEPLLYPMRIFNTISDIRLYNKCPIYLYTAKLDDVYLVYYLINFLDGITVTLHEKEDIVNFNKLDKLLVNQHIPFNKSFRLNVFKEVGEVKPIIPGIWQIKDNIEWIKDCPLPTNEVFMKAY
jgi:hypothetical protein